MKRRKCNYCGKEMPESYEKTYGPTYWPWIVNHRFYCSRNCILWEDYKTNRNKVQARIRRMGVACTLEEELRLTQANGELCRPRTKDPLEVTA